MVLLSLKNVPDIPFCGGGKRARYRTRPGGRLRAGESGQKNITVRGNHTVATVLESVSTFEGICIGIVRGPWRSDGGGKNLCRPLGVNWDGVYRAYRYDS